MSFPLGFLIKRQLQVKENKKKMNPFGARLVYPGAANGANSFDEEKPHVTAIIHGPWHVVYSWPPQALEDHPRMMTFAAPSKLETVLFGCRCREEIADKLHPVKVFAEKVEVKACELINEEGQVRDALDRTVCECRTTPMGEKFAALPVNENILLHYQQYEHVQYTSANPNTCLLLFRHLPSSIEIDAAIEGLDVAKRWGDVTFKIKQE